MDQSRIFVGRKDELAIFKSMLDQTIESWLFALSGPGGIGKTWLLQEFISVCQERGTLHSDLIDLYYTDRQTKTGLLRAIGSSIGMDHFPGLPSALRQSGKNPADLRAGKLSEAVSHFVAGLEALSDGQRIPIFFDTFEKIVGTGTAEWFMTDVVPELHGSAIVVCAGRNGFWLEGGKKKVSGVPGHGEVEIPLTKKVVSLLRLGAFDQSDVHQYLKEYLERREEKDVPLMVDSQRYGDLETPPSEIEAIWRKTDGHPVLVALSADWLAEWGTGVIADVAEVSPEEFTRELVSKVRELETPEDEAIVRMAHVYHRFNADILGVTYAELKQKKIEPGQVVQNLSRFSFVKYHPKTGDCLLHDEMQHLIEEFVLNEIDKTKDLRREISTEVVKYYDQVLEREEDERTRWVMEAERMYHRLYGDLEDARVEFWHAMDDAWSTYRLDLMRMLLSKGEEVNERLEDPLLRVLCNASRAWVSLEEWDVERARELAESVLEDSASIQRTRATALAAIGVCEQRRGEGDLAVERFKEALDIYRGLEETLKSDQTLPEEGGIPTLKGVRDEMAMLRNRMGIVYRKKGELDKAIEHYMEARSIALDAENMEWWTASLNNIGNVERLRGNLKKAESLCNQALKRREELHENRPGLAFQRDIALSHNTLGMVLRDMRQHDEAQEYFETAEEMFEQLHDRSGLARALRNQGWVHFLQAKATQDEGEKKELFCDALELYERSRKVCEEFKVEPELPNLWNKIGIVERALGNLEKAKQAYNRSLELARKHNDSIFVANDLVRLAELAYQTGGKENRQQIEAYADALKKEFEDQGFRFELAYAEMEELLGEMALDAGRYEEAFEHLGESFAYLAQLNRWRFDRKLYVLRNFFEALPEKDQRRARADQLKQFWASRELDEEYAHLTTICEEYIMVS